jgi:contactin associated protein-like 2
MDTNRKYLQSLHNNRRKKVKKIATLGRANHKEYVTEFIIQFSDDGELWRTYTDSNAQDQVKHL